MESVWSVSKLSIESVGSRRELVANSVHTADVDATQLDSRVASASAVCIGQLISYVQRHCYLAPRFQLRRSFPILRLSRSLRSQVTTHGKLLTLACNYFVTKHYDLVLANRSVMLSSERVTAALTVSNSRLQRGL